MRIPLEAFVVKEPALDLTNVTSIAMAFNCPGAFGAEGSTGAIGFDEIEFSR